MRKLLVVLIILCSFNAIAQKKNFGKVQGKVVDKQTKEALVGVNVVLDSTSLGDATDISGQYTILKVPAGKYNLRVSYVGYQIVTVKDVIIKKNETTTIDIALEAQNVEMHEVAITAERPLIQKSVTASLSVTSGQVMHLQAGISYEESWPRFNTEEYDKIHENEFLESVQNPLSTFSIDVDVASYANVRRFINNGSLPPPDAVRIEELINYFSYDYPDPDGKHPFSVTTELSTAPWNSDNHLLLIGLQGKKIETKNLPPSNLVFLLDVSGSMDDPVKLPLVKSAFRLLVGQLRPQDKVSIVVYAGSAGLVLPSTSGKEKEKIIAAIEQLEAGGSTAGGQGIVLAYKIAKENFLTEGNNRVILATDGDFNVGLSSDADLERLIEEKRKEGIFLSVLGFGTGNYKDSKMEKLADKGNGNYAYIDNILEAKKVFVGQMAGTLYTIAKDVKLQIEFNPAKVKAYRLIGYENRMLKKEDFNDDRKDAGDMGAGHTVTALYELVLADSKIALPKVDSLKYQSTKISEDAHATDELLTLKLRYKSPKDSTSQLMETVVKANSFKQKNLSNNFVFACAVAEYGMLLRDSKLKGNADFDHVIDSAKESKGKDEEGYRGEFIKLVEISESFPKFDPNR